MSATIDRIIEIVRHELERARAPLVLPKLNADTHFGADLSCKAIDLCCISIEVEDAFGINLPSEIPADLTIGKLAQHIDRLCATRILHVVPA